MRVNDDKTLKLRNFILEYGIIAPNGFKKIPIKIIMPYRLRRIAFPGARAQKYCEISIHKDTKEYFYYFYFCVPKAIREIPFVYRRLSNKDAQDILNQLEPYYPPLYI